MRLLTLYVRAQWIINVCFFVVGNQFADWTKGINSQRNEALAQKRDLNIEIDEEILDILMASNAISTHKGSSAGLLKIGSKRRRTKAEIEGLKEEEALRAEAAANKDIEIQRLRA